MDKCITKGCGSYAINDAPSTGLCDVCLYKIPLLDLLARIHRDGGQYTEKNGLEKAVEDAHEAIAYLTAIL